MRVLLVQAGRICACCQKKKKIIDNNNTHVWQRVMTCETWKVRVSPRMRPSLQAVPPYEEVLELGNSAGAY
jgi:hypothetical protein